MAGWHTTVTINPSAREVLTRRQLDEESVSGCVNRLLLVADAALEQRDAKKLDKAAREIVNAERAAIEAEKLAKYQGAVARRRIAATAKGR